MLYCPECGKKLLKASEKYCTECGSSISGKSASQVKNAAAKANIAKPTWDEKKAGAAAAAPKKPFGAREMAISAAVVLLIAALVNAGLFAGVQGMEKGRQATPQAQMAETLQKYREDIKRQQIDADAAKAAQISSELAQFVQTFSYGGMQMGATAQEYNITENVSDSNLARKAAAAKKLALQANEFYSQIEGMKAFAIENWADIERISGGKANMSEEGLGELDSMTAQFKKMELAMALELEVFANTSSSRMAIAADAIKTLKESAG